MPPVTPSAASRPSFSRLPGFRLLGVLALVGCGSGGGGGAYTVAVTPIVPTNQSPFDGVDNVVLSVLAQDGSTQDFDLGAPDGGITLSGKGIPALEDSALIFSGYSGSDVVSRGRTGVLTRSSGSEDRTVLFGSVEQVGWIGGLSTGVAGPLVLPVGGGRFHVFGGIGTNNSGEWTKLSEVVQEVSLESPVEGFVPAELGPAPTWTDLEGDDHTGFFGSSIAAITVGADAGRYFIGGGGAGPGLLDPKSVTPDVWLYNPEDASFEELSGRESLASPHAEAATVVDAQGAVILWGGWTQNDSDRSVAVSTNVEVWEPETRRASVLKTYAIASTPMFDGAGVSLGSQGSLFCGGSLQDNMADADGVNYASWYTDAQCHRVSLGHDILVDTSLPVAVAGLAMVTLDDGRVLAAGGANQPTEVFVDFDTTAPAISDAWIYDPGTSEWSSAGSMNVARVGHKMAVLPDGRVLIAGGSATYMPGSVLGTGLSCVEVFDPADDSFTPLANCDADSDTDGLAGRAGLPGLAVDPDFGAVVIGGFSDRTTAQNAVNVILPAE